MKQYYFFSDILSMLFTIPTPCITQIVHKSETKLHMQQWWFATSMSNTSCVVIWKCLQVWTGLTKWYDAEVQTQTETVFIFILLTICSHTQSHCKWMHTWSLSYSCVFVSAFVYLVGLKEFAFGRDDSKHIQAYYWLPLEWSGTVCALIGWGPHGSRPKSVTLLLGWSHSMLLPVWVPGDWQQGSRAPCPAGCLRASPCLTPPYPPILLCQDPFPLGP